MNQHRTHLPLSVLAIAVLGVTACGGSDQGDDGGDDGSADQEQQSPEQETQDPAEEAPPLSEVEESMWSAMQEAESVEMSVQGMSLDQAAVEQAESLDIDTSVFTISGSVQQPAMMMSIGEEAEPFMMAVEDAGYVSASAGTMFLPEAFAQELDMDSLEQELDGLWVEFPGEAGGEDLTLASLLEDFQQDWESAGQDAEGTESSSESPSASGESESVQRDDFAEEGEHEVREGQDVWVYSAEEAEGELVILADEQAPYMLEATDGETTLTFNQWDEAEIPEQPEQDALITQSEFEELIADSATTG